MYISLTCTFYIWALRKSWPSVSDQFSFAFGADYYATAGNSNATLSPEFTTMSPSTSTFTSTITKNATEANFTITTSTMIPMSILANQTTVTFTSSNSSSSISKFFRTFTFFRNLFPAKSSNKPEGMDSGNVGKMGGESYTLWSSGFLALYVIQRAGKFF